MIKPQLRRVRHRLRTHAAEHPAIYLRLARVKRALGVDVRDLQRQAVGARTELVIDGYTRCGSTFAVYALQLSQPEPVRVAHHWHAPAQFIEAARRRIPALLLIRQPQGAIISQLIREPDRKLQDALVAYSRFYTCLLPYRDAFVVGDFEQVTHDFGGVIRRLNARFGTRFAEFVPTEANLQECFGLMKLRGNLSPALFSFESGELTREQLQAELARGMSDGRHWDAADAWVPSQDRERAKAVVLQDWNDPSMTELRERAWHVYRAITEGR